MLGRAHPGSLSVAFSAPTRSRRALSRHAVRANADRHRDASAAETEVLDGERLGSESKASSSSTSTTRKGGATRPRRRSDDRPDTKDLFGLFTHPAPEMKARLARFQLTRVAEISLSVSGCGRSAEVPMTQLGCRFSSTPWCGQTFCCPHRPRVGTKSRRSGAPRRGSRFLVRVAGFAACLALSESLSEYMGTFRS